VVLPGLLQGEEVSAAFSDADLYVLPCRTDTFPQTILEACRAGTPMVISETCETAYLVKDRIGEVVPFDADAFAGAIDALLADQSRYARYESECGVMMRDVFNIEKSVDRLETLYRQVIGEAR
jgi:glycosyltransferase involved in cell wall biosynthesis